MDATELLDTEPSKPAPAQLTRPIGVSATRGATNRGHLILILGASYPASEHLSADDPLRPYTEIDVNPLKTLDKFGVCLKKPNEINGLGDSFSIKINSIFINISSKLSKLLKTNDILGQSGFPAGEIRPILRGFRAILSF